MSSSQSKMQEVVDANNLKDDDRMEYKRDVAIIEEQTIELHSKPDLTLYLGKSLLRVEVRKSAMDYGSPVWRAMFEGPWKEKTASSITLEEDDPDAMLLVLRILHGHSKGIPEALKWTQIVQLAVICDKYDMVDQVRKHLEGKDWLEPYKSLVLEVGYEDWLFIAWTFGDLDTFKKLARHLALTTVRDSKGRLSRISRTKEGVKFAPLTHSEFTDAFIRTIDEARARVRIAIINLCKANHSKAWSFTCSIGEDEQEKMKCKAAIVGYLEVLYVEAGLMSPNNKAFTLTETMNKLQGQHDMAYQSITCGKCHKAMTLGPEGAVCKKRIHVRHGRYNEVVDSSLSHGQCAQSAIDSYDYAALIDRMALVTDDQVRHMEVQAKKGL